MTIQLAKGLCSSAPVRAIENVVFPLIWTKKEQWLKTLGDFVLTNRHIL